MVYSWQIMTTDASEVRSGSRERLLESARRLFYGRGINSTGVDVLLAESGVAKGSMYHHFHGKQGVVLAYLTAEKDTWVREARAADRPERPSEDRVGLLFESLSEAVRSGAFHGCPFTNATVERPDDAEVGAIVTEYRALFAGHLAELLSTDPEDPLVERVTIIYDGATTAAKLTRDPDRVAFAGRMAREEARKARTE